MSNSPPSQRDRRSLQDLAKLASSPSLAPPSNPSPQSVPAPAVPSTNAEQDSGIVDLKVMATVDADAARRAQTTPLASTPLFEDDAAPSIPPPSHLSTPASAPSSLRGASASLPSAPLSSPVASSPHLAVPADAKKSPLPMVLGGLAVVLVAAGAFFLTRDTKTEPVASATVQPVAMTTPPASAAVSAQPEPAPHAAVQNSPNVPDTIAAAGGTSPTPATDQPTTGAGNPGARRHSGRGSAATSANGSDLSNMMAQASKPTTASAAASPSVPGAPPGALGDAVQHAVGANGAQPPVSAVEAPAAPEFAPGSVPDKPSQGAVQGAIGRALPSARACLNPDDPVSRANITFSSAGAVSAVVVSGSAANKSAEDCIKSALMKASVPPFSQASYSANVTVRPN